MVDRTRERISQAALRLFLEQGVRKTSLEEVAEQAGVSRMTIYRYFPDKPALVREAFLGLAALFAAAHEDIRREAAGGIDAALDRVFLYFDAMPQGPALARLDELKKLYPDIFDAYRRTRREALNGIFECLRDAMVRQGVLRSGLNEDVVRAVFLEALLNVVDNPALKELGVPPSEVYATIRTVLLHGVIAGAAPEPPPRAPKGE